MRLLWVVAAGLALVGCGPAFEGTWTGTLYSTIQCGSETETTPVDVRWQLADDGARLDIVTGGTCGTWSAVPHGDSADIEMKVCPSSSSGGYTFSPTLTDGTLSVDGDRLRVEFLVSFVVTGAVSGVCSDITDGTLHREQ